MTSKSIYTTVPYFYIIQHKVTKNMYAGSRWAKGCHPDEFMQLNGYTTSSKIINRIIEQEGLDSFKVLRIDTNLDGLSALEYESLFLQTIDCSSSNYWYNGHNNTGILSLGTDKFKFNMIEKYGVDHNSKIPEFKNKQQNSLKKTLMERYGVEHQMQVPIFNEKQQISRKLNNIEKYGVEYISQLPEVKTKVIESRNKTLMERYGVVNAFQCPEVKDKIKNTNMEKYGVDHPSKMKFFSLIETRKTYTKNILSRCYPEFKQYF